MPGREHDAWRSAVLGLMGQALGFVARRGAAAGILPGERLLNFPRQSPATCRKLHATGGAAGGLDGAAEFQRVVLQSRWAALRAICLTVTLVIGFCAGVMRSELSAVRAQGARGDGVRTHFLLDSPRRPAS